MGEEGPAGEEGVRATLEETYLALDKRKAAAVGKGGNAAAFSALEKHLSENLEDGSYRRVILKQTPPGVAESEDATVFRSNVVANMGQAAAKAIFAMPTSSSTVLAPNIMRVLWALRFYLPLECLRRVAGEECRCSSSKRRIYIDARGRHCLGCNKYSRYNARHNKALASWAALFAAAGLNCLFEPKYWLREVAGRTMEVQDDGGGSDDEDESVPSPVQEVQLRPDGLLCGAGEHGKDVAMDITFTNCLSTENVGASDKKQLKEVAP